METLVDHLQQCLLFVEELLTLLGFWSHVEVKDRSRKDDKFLSLKEMRKVDVSLLQMPGLKSRR